MVGGRQGGGRPSALSCGHLLPASQELGEQKLLGMEPTVTADGKVKQWVQPVFS